MELLTRQDPMVFFSEIHFFEDELNDFGHCAVNVKLVSFHPADDGTIATTNPSFDPATTLLAESDEGVLLLAASIHPAGGWSAGPSAGRETDARIFQGLHAQGAAIKGEEFWGILFGL